MCGVVAACWSCRPAETALQSSRLWPPGNRTGSGLLVLDGVQRNQAPGAVKWRGGKGEREEDNNSAKIGNINVKQTENVGTDGGLAGRRACGETVLGLVRATQKQKLAGTHDHMRWIADVTATKD